MLALSAAVAARAAMGQASARMQAQTPSDAEAACVGRLTVAALALGMRRVWRADTESTRPPADLVPTTDLPSRPRQPCGEAPRDAPCGGRRPCVPRAGERPCARPCDARPSARPCGERLCVRRGDEPPSARPCDAPPCGRPCGARPCEQPSWLYDVVPSPTLLCIGLAHPRDPLGEMAPAWDRVVPPTVNRLEAPRPRSAATPVVTQHERERDGGMRVHRSILLCTPLIHRLQAQNRFRHANECVRDTSAKRFDVHVRRADNVSRMRVRVAHFVRASRALSACARDARTPRIGADRACC